MERDQRTHLHSTDRPFRCSSREDRPQYPDWHQLRIDLKRTGVTNFALELWDVLREHLDHPSARLHVHTHPINRRSRVGHPPDFDHSLEGAKRLLELVDQEPADVSKGKISSAGPLTKMETDLLVAREAMTNASYIRRLQKQGEIKNALLIDRLAQQDVLADESRIIDCWQKKYRQFWYVVLYMVSHTSVGNHMMNVLVEILDRLYGLCYNHNESCPGHRNREPVGHLRCTDKGSCQSELDNPFRQEKYMWLWERLPECWNTFELYAPLFRTIANHNPEHLKDKIVLTHARKTDKGKAVVKDEEIRRGRRVPCNSNGTYSGPKWTLHSNCIPDEAFTPYAPSTGSLSIDEWIRLNAFLARFVRLRGEDKPFVHEGGKPYMVLWLKGMYAMIEAFEVTQISDGRIFEHQLEDTFEAYLENLPKNQLKNICQEQLMYWIEAQLKAKSQAQLQVDNEVLMAALGAACVWIIYGRLTATYLEKNSRILREDLFAQIEKDNFPGYMNIRWGRHPYATGNLQISGLLMDWEARYYNWRSRLEQIIDDYSGNGSWIFTLAREASKQTLEDWLEEETEYYVSQPVGSLLPEWEREIGCAVELFRKRCRDGGGRVPNSATMPMGSGNTGRLRNRRGAAYDRPRDFGSQGQSFHGQQRHRQPEFRPNGAIRGGMPSRGIPRVTTGSGNNARRNQQDELMQETGLNQHWEIDSPSGLLNRQPRQQTRNTQPNGVMSNGIPTQRNINSTPRIPPGFSPTHHQHQHESNPTHGRYRTNRNQSGQRSSQGPPRIPPGFEPSQRQQQREPNSILDDDHGGRNRRGRWSGLDRALPLHRSRQSQSQQSQTHNRQRNGQDGNQRNQSRTLTAYEVRQRVLREEREARCEVFVRRSVVKMLVGDFVLFGGAGLRGGWLGRGRE